MRFLKANCTEKEQIFELISENSRWLHSKEVDQWAPEWIESQRSQIFESVNEGFFRVYYKGEILAAVVELRTEPQGIWGYDTSKSLYVQKFAVGVAFKGQRLGGSLMGEIISWAKSSSLEYVRLDCAEKNMKLRLFYESLGFVLAGTKAYGGFDTALYEIDLKDVN